MSSALASLVLSDYADTIAELGLSDDHAEELVGRFRFVLRQTKKLTTPNYKRNGLRIERL
jgi:hypothetical protein